MFPSAVNWDHFSESPKKYFVAVESEDSSKNSLVRQLFALLKLMNIGYVIFSFFYNQKV